MIRNGWVMAGLVLLVGAGCQQSPGPAVQAPPASNAAAAGPIADWPPTRAQPRLQTMKLFVGPEVVNSEVALTHAELGTGMMFRKEMPENEGMLFVFGAPHRAAFYMKNTILPLTAAYIDGEGAILELHDLQPLKEEPVEAGSDNVQFVLEMNQGWFKRHNVGIGSLIVTEHGRFKDTFRFRPE